jgi:FkbM family methyltransferase
MIFLPKRFNFIDVGAYQGDITRQYFTFLRSVPQRFHLIEPNPTNFELLEKTMQGFNLYKLAISDHDGEEEFFYDPEFLNASSLYKEMPEGKGNRESIVTMKTPCLTMDSFLEKHNLETADFLKINCEGGEYKMFGAPTLQFLSVTTYLLISWHGKRECFNSEPHVSQRQRINKMLLDKGFRFLDGVKPTDIGLYGSKSHSLQYWKKD